MTQPASKRSIGIRKASKDVRRYVAAANMWLLAGDVPRAYAFAEAAQDAAFDLKHLIAGNLGEYESGHNDPQEAP